MKGRFSAVVVLCAVCVIAIWIVYLSLRLKSAELIRRPSTLVNAGVTPSPMVPNQETGVNIHPTKSSTSSQTSQFPTPPHASIANSPFAAAASAPSNLPTHSENPVPTTTSSPEDSASGYVSPSVELDQLQLTTRNFGSRFGANPVGTNAEITAALKGANPKHVRFLDPAARTNAKGELLDAWNTPYFFHQLSSHQMEIRSAGADRKMWTGDDLISY